jgi:hypothetical protein
MPALATLLAAADWAPTPELSGVFEPGVIFAEEAEGQGHRPLARGCVATAPTDSSYTAAELVTQLQAGVAVGGFVRGSTSFVKKLRFETPVQRSIATLDLVLTADCAARLARLDAQTLARAYVVQEVLSARISEQTCGEVDAAGRFVGLGGADAALTEACAQVSLEPVAVGYRTVPLARLWAAPAAAAADTAPLPPARRPAVALVHAGGAELCVVVGGAAPSCAKVRGKDDFAGLARLQDALGACPEAPDMAAALMDWRRHRVNRAVAIGTMYGAPFAGIPGKKARAALAAAQAAAARCGG